MNLYNKTFFMHVVDKREGLEPLSIVGKGKCQKNAEKIFIRRLVQKYPVRFGVSMVPLLQEYREHMKITVFETENIYIPCWEIVSW